MPDELRRHLDSTRLEHEIGTYRAEVSVLPEMPTVRQVVAQPGGGMKTPIRRHWHH